MLLLQEQPATGRSTIAYRRFSAPNVVVGIGVLLCLFVFMFRPGGASATLPQTLDIFPAWNSSVGNEFSYQDAPTITKTYDVKLKGETKTTPTQLTGKSIIDLMKLNGIDPLKTGEFVKIRFGPRFDSATTDAQILLLPLALDKPDTPPMVLDSGMRKGIGPFPTPAVVPAQVSPNGINENQFFAFKEKATKLTIVPSKQGAKLMGVQIKSKRTSKGEYQFTASVTANKPSGALRYEWYSNSADSTGSRIKVSDNSRYTTKDPQSAKGGTAHYDISVVVSSPSTGSTGSQVSSYNSKKKDDGRKGPPPSEKNNGSTNSTGGTGFNQQGSTGGTGGTYTQPVPPTTTPPSTTTTPQSTIPPPVTTPQVVDTSGITNIAQNVSSSSPVTTVNGVLLSSPTVPPAGDGGGGGSTPAGLQQLSQPVASELNTIFKPVDSADDIWPYLIAVLFALCFSGAVREWVNP